MALKSDERRDAARENDDLVARYEARLLAMHPGGLVERRLRESVEDREQAQRNR